MKKTYCLLCVLMLMPLSLVQVEASENRTQEDLVIQEKEKDLLFKNEIDEAVDLNKKRISETEKIKEALIEVNPKLAHYNDDDYTYNHETGSIEFHVSKEKMFNNEFERSSAWSLLDRGDILVNHSTSSSFELLKYGHAALMDSKGLRPNESTTFETRGYGTTARAYDYLAWHNNNKDKISYNYVRSKYNQANFKQITTATLNKARSYHGTKYYIGLNNASTANGMYCSQIVYLAYYLNGVERVDLGNGIAYGSNRIVLPVDLYLDNDVYFYYRQGF
ncbi:MAG: hypothetical protein ACRC3J_03400 [Culicoidibacterales bacterium]